MGIVVQHPGLLTTVQDTGRWGYQHLGVPVAGPMDVASHRLANLLVGNDDRAASLEVTLAGPELHFEESGVVAVTGAEFAAQLDGVDVPMHTSCFVRRGQTLAFGARTSGARGYVGVAGGIDVPPVLGSRATHMASGVGGLAGRALRMGDRLSTGEVGSATYAGRSASPVIPLSADGARVRFVPGPNQDRFDDAELDRFEKTRFTITTESDRMGYRLEGSTLAVRDGGELISRAVVHGTVQVPPNGRPIVLMADRQTAGGYPSIVTVISADLPVVGQLSAGQWIEFTRCTQRQALEALEALERRIMEW